MTACSLAVLCNVERFLCKATPWGRDGSDLCREGVGEGERPQQSDVLIPKRQEIRRCADSPERSQTPPWKFWRKLSSRRTDKKPRSATKYSAAGSRAGHRTDWTHPSHLDLDLQPVSRTVVEDDAPVTSGSLPDVVDKAVLRRSSSLKAPPKPPRLFLFRSSSINHPRSSVDGGSARNSMVCGAGGVDVLAEAEPIYVNSAFSAAMMKTGLSGNDRIIPPSVYNNNNNNNELGKGAGTEHSRQSQDMEVAKVHKAGRNGTLPHPPKPTSSSTSSSTTSYNTLPNPKKPHNKLTNSPDLTSRRNGGRSRRKSSSEKYESCRHTHIMHSVLGLLCQRFDPFPLLDALQSAGVLAPLDVQAFRGHPDRKLICESLANAIGDGDYTHFVAFLEVVRAAGSHEEIVRVLDAMRAIDRLIHDLPCPPDTLQQDEDNQILADEKMISYEVGYLAPDGLTLKPVVELERVRPAERKVSQRVSKLSGLSTCSGEGDSGSEKNGDSSMMSVPYVGPVMMNACVTGHNLSGERALALAEVIKQHDCILELRIGKTQLCSPDLVAICGALVHNSSLASLDIRLNALDFIGASAVAKMLSHTQALRQLNLSSTGLDVAGFQAVLTAVTSNKTVTDLDMSFLDAGDAVCQSIRDTLRTNTCLQKLRLRSNNFSSTGCAVLAEGLNRNRTLLELDLSRNCIGDDGVDALARYVPESSLAELCLENCSVTSEGCEALSQLISGSKRLRSLDLSVNLLGDIGVLRLGAALERSSTLQTLGLNMSGVTNDGFSQLLDVLEKNASISLLKLCYNRLGREHLNPAATSDNLRYRLRIVTSSKPKLKILLWGNSFDEA
ncbi:uncharacterized protein [Littorina saxatilis]|uniref:uncharacterized protein n=1 Tax=Littorina saxatilis TaxID=31220 RepID=UPI0038B4DD4C